MLNAFAKEKEMSERIKELRDRAVVLACLSYEEQTTQTFADNKSFEQLLSEKFAELIIRECITVTKNVENGYSDYRNQIEDGMREAIISNIEHHFGVNNEPKV